MICYKDQAYCPFWVNCIDWKECGRAMTPDIIDEADRLGLPIYQLLDKPGCFITKEDKK